MKKYLLGLFAVALAVGFSAFTNATFTKKAVQQDKYFLYQSGTERDINNYIQNSSVQSSCFGASAICWLYVADLNSNDVIEESEFLAAFDAIDADHDQLISDQTEDGVDLEKKQ